MCSLFCGVTSIVAQLVLNVQRTLAAETRRIQQRRAAQRRAQRKARGTLLTALRPVSQRGFFRGLSLFVIRDSHLVSFILSILDLLQLTLKAKIFETVKDPCFMHLVKPKPTSPRAVSFCQGIESILNFQAAKAAKARPAAIG